MELRKFTHSRVFGVPRRLPHKESLPGGGSDDSLQLYLSLLLRATPKETHDIYRMECKRVSETMARSMLSDGQEGTRSNKLSASLWQLYYGRIHVISSASRLGSIGLGIGTLGDQAMGSEYPTFSTSHV